MADDKSRLLWDWQNEAGNIEAFLKDPLEWIANELDRVFNEITNRKPDTSPIPDLESLVRIIRFVNKHKYLINETT